MSDDFWTKQATMPPPSLEGGASSYFSAPSETLDPNLFHGMRLLPEVRANIMHNLDEGLQTVLATRVDESALHVWLAGSGITYQWNASRGNGDLDVLFSIDMASLIYFHPEFRGYSADELAPDVTSKLKGVLWPYTSETVFGDGTYEVTYFWDSKTGNDIRHIHPYAAYCVTDDMWVVRPPKLPEDPHSLYDQSWYDEAQHDTDAADVLSAAYRLHTGTMALSAYGSSSYVNAKSAVHVAIHQARMLFDDIHKGRASAFTSPLAKGYGDYANFRWQAAKNSGAINVLKSLADIDRAEHKAREEAEYGQVIQPADVVTRQALDHVRNYGK